MVGHSTYRLKFHLFYLLSCLGAGIVNARLGNLGVVEPNCI